VQGTLRRVQRSHPIHQYPQRKRRERKRKEGVRGRVLGVRGGEVGKSNESVENMTSATLLLLPTAKVV
jgi:hypothetical protein